MNHATAHYATAVSQHPDSAIAVAEVIGQSLEHTGGRPGLAVIFTSGPHTPHPPLIARAIQKGLSPSVLLGSSASGTLAHRHEIEKGPSIVLWTTLIEDVRPLRLESPALPDDVKPGHAEPDHVKPDNVEPEHIAGIMKAAGTRVLVALAPFPGSDIWAKVEAIRDQVPTLTKVLYVDAAQFLPEAEAVALYRGARGRGNGHLP